MLIYLRKITLNDTKKQIESTEEAYLNFFGGNNNSPSGVDLRIYTENGGNQLFKISKAAGNANSYRFSATIKGQKSIAKFINENIKGGYNAGDILRIIHNQGKYVLDIIHKDDSKYDTLNALLPSRQNTVITFDEDINDNEKENTKYDILIGYNKIFYGIPGCGKSFRIEKEVLEKVDKEKNVFRTTFYLDYSNSDFIGQIYPKVDGEGNVSYEEVPGPFTKALERALTSKDGKMVYLVIEEINRGNAAAIFGDTFQLLDRLRENRNGRVVGDSEYPISNAFIEGYFAKNKVPFTPNKIYIPHNLTILATMNTSDQNVFPLDTAFKRRWDREKVTNDWDKVGNIKKLYIPYTDITWEKFATTINQYMIKESKDADAPISEDKQMGAYFARDNMLSEHKDNQLDSDEKNKAKSFTNNVLDYLYNDVTKFDHDVLFNSKIATIDDIYNLVNEYEKDQNINSSKVFKKIFKPKIAEKLTGQLIEEEPEQSEEDIDDEE